MGTGLGLGIGTAVGGIASAIGNVISAREQNAANLNIQREQNAYNLNMWQLENMYNSPEAQMDRYKQAGLNPNLIYGSATNQHSNAPTSAPRQNIPIPWGNVGEAISQGFNSSLQALQMEKSLQEADSRIAANNANADMKTAQKNNILLQNIWNTARNKAGADTNFWSHRLAAQIFQNDLTLERKRYLQLQGAYLPSLYAARISNLDSSTALNGSQLFVNDAKIRNLDSSTSLNYSNKDYIESKRAGQEILNDLDRYLSSFKKEGAAIDTSIKYEQLEQTRRNIDVLVQRADQLEKENNYYEAQMIWSIIKDLLPFVPGKRMNVDKTVKYR